MDHLKQTREGGVWTGGNEVRDRLVKSNILYIDGRNLLQSRMLDYYPLGRSGSEASQASDGISNSANSGSSLSRYVLEILVFLCRSDSRLYSRRFGVPPHDYRETLSQYTVSLL